MWLTRLIRKRAERRLGELMEVARKAGKLAKAGGPKKSGFPKDSLGADTPFPGGGYDVGILPGPLGLTAAKPRFKIRLRTWGGN